MRTCLLLVSILLPGAAQAQKPLSLTTAIELARQSNPLLRSAAGRVAEARGAVTQAGLRPNPRAYLQTENWRGWSNPALRPGDQVDTYAYLSVPMETAGKRGARTELARAAERRSALERELLERQVVARIKQAYWAAAGAERILRAHRDNVATFRQVIEYHEARVREGAMAEADLLRVRLEGERLELAANAARLDAERARIELFRAMGANPDQDAVLSDTLDPPPAAPMADVERALGDRTEMKLARQAREVARAGLGVQKSLASPDIDFLVGYKRTAGFSTVMGGAQWNLPFFNRNQGNIISAEASVGVAESDMAAAEAVIRAEVKAADADVRMRARQLTGTLGRMRQQADESAKIAVAAYREGGTDLLRLLDAQRLRIETETLYYRTVSEFRQSIVALETAMGVSE